MKQTKRKNYPKTTARRLKWQGILKVEDILPKRNRWGDIYATLYTEVCSIVASEHQASKLCLYEPYEMKGEIVMREGGMYLRLLEAQLFRSDEYRQVVR